MGAEPPRPARLPAGKGLDPADIVRVQMQRAGSCHACPSCGTTSGRS